MNWYLAVLKNYAGFEGRARRKEYWMFYLFHMIAVLILEAIASAVAITVAILTDSPAGLFAFALVVAYGLATFIPTLAVTVRRLHDTGRSGWWYLITLVPWAGSIVLLVFTVDDGEPHDNQYGPNPKPQAPYNFYYGQGMDAPYPAARLDGHEETGRHRRPVSVRLATLRGSR